MIISNIEIKKLSRASLHRARSTESAHINTKINVCCVSACAGMCVSAHLCEKEGNVKSEQIKVMHLRITVSKLDLLGNIGKWFGICQLMSLFLFYVLCIPRCAHICHPFVRSYVSFARSLARSRTLVIFMDFMSPWKFRGHGEVVTFLFVVVMINEQHPKHGSQR